MDVRDRIERLSAAIGGDVRVENAEAWWTDFQLIESAIEFDPRATKQERELVTRLKDTLSRFIGAVRDGAPSPDVSSVRVWLTALDGEIQKRTIGPDGWPLRGR